MPAGSSVMLGAHVVSETLFYVWRSCVIGNFVSSLDVLCYRKVCFMFGAHMLVESFFYAMSACASGKFILCAQLIC